MNRRVEFKVIGGTTDGQVQQAGKAAPAKTAKKKPAALKK
jgi:hypothetical protein